MESTLRQLTPKQVIIAMVNGLKHPRTKIDMETFGRKEGGVCYGCAATSAICELFDIKNPGDYIQEQEYASAFGFSNTILNKVEYKEDIIYFERAINYLRMAEVSKANMYLSSLGIKPIKYELDKVHCLECLGDNYTLEQLEPYIALAEYQDVVNNENK